MTPEQLLKQFEESEEPKGYYLHADREHCIATAEALISNLEEYGYMNCPCRLPNNDPAMDEDVICPCAYRDSDVAEYGSCFCNLFVDEAHRGQMDFFPEVEDSRPVL